MSWANNEIYHRSDTSTTIGGFRETTFELPKTSLGTQNSAEERRLAARHVARNALGMGDVLELLDVLGLDAAEGLDQ